MKKIKGLYLLTFILLLLSCEKEGERGQTPQKNMDFTLIGKGNLTSGGVEEITKSNIVIKSMDRWNELITRMDTGNDVSGGFTETNVDFNSFTIIAVFDEVKSNGGHSIDIIEIAEQENTIQVKIDNLLKGNLTTVMTQPFHIVKFEKKEKDIEFK